jgi:hypothetical protein
MEGPIPPGQERPLPQLAHPQPRLSRAAGNQLISSVHLFPNAFPCPSSRFFIRRALGALTGLCLLAGGVSIAQTQLPGSTGKGPVGWDSYRRPDLFPKLRSGTETREFSSTDPAQANGDFNHPLRVTSDGQYVIAEANGAGEIVSIWSTINGGDVTNDGLITIELDGHVVLSTNYQALVSGALGAPWVWPLVGNLYDTSGGAQIKVPMPYTQSMRVIRTLKIQVQSQSWSRPDPHLIRSIYPGSQIPTALGLSVIKSMVRWMRPFRLIPLLWSVNRLSQDSSMRVLDWNNSGIIESELSMELAIWVRSQTL